MQETIKTFSLNVSGPSILALGGELKNTICLTQGAKVFMGPLIGDLKDFDIYLKYKEAIALFKSTLGITPEVIAYDQHPDYLSTRYAQEVPATFRKIAVWHHQAHVAACMLENAITDKVIGVAFDGTGYGQDGTIWGGEFFVGNAKGFKREFHLKYVPMPGADAAARQPWRMAVSYIHQAFAAKAKNYCTRFKDGSFVLSMIEKKVNCPLTSSMGRLFDAVASIAGICDVHEYEADAAIRLEKLCGGTCDLTPYTYNIENGVIDVSLMIREIITGSESAVVIAKRFHSTIANIILSVSSRIRDDTGIKKVVLCGGVFLNKVLTRKIKGLLLENGFEVFTHKKISPGDSALSLGQAAIAHEAV